MSFSAPESLVDLEPWPASVGTVFTEIRGHDSGCTSFGVKVDGERWFGKTAPRSERWQLDGAIRVHAVLHHPAVVPLVTDFEVTGGHAVVYAWVEGENLNDPNVPGASGTALERFRQLPDPDSSAAYDLLLGAHVAVEEAGLVAVDLYDGCVIHDPGLDRDEIHLVDLDLYTPPYRLDVDRQYGSTRLMPPEELARGSWVDHRASVFTLDRLAVHLRCGRTVAHAAVVERATRPAPGDRYPTVAAYSAAWRAC